MPSTVTTPYRSSTGAECPSLTISISIGLHDGDTRSGNGNDLPTDVLKLHSCKVREHRRNQSRFWGLDSRGEWIGFDLF